MAIVFLAGADDLIILIFHSFVDSKKFVLRACDEPGLSLKFWSTVKNNTNTFISWS
jgi:hypothetical protein